MSPLLRVLSMDRRKHKHKPIRPSQQPPLVP
jgi:hypothetical protein